MDLLLLIAVFVVPLVSSECGNESQSRDTCRGCYANAPSYKERRLEYPSSALTLGGPAL